jgi:hypothetical protein
LFPLFATGVKEQVEMVAKFAAGVVDTGGKFDTGGAPCLANFRTNS